MSGSDEVVNKDDGLYILSFGECGLQLSPLNQTLVVDVVLVDIKFCESSPTLTRSVQIANGLAP